MIRIFQKSSPAQYLLLMLITALVRAVCFWEQEPAALSLDRQVSLYLTGYWYEIILPYPWIQVLIPVVLYIEALIFGQLMVSRKVMDGKALLASLLFALISSVAGPWVCETHVLFANGLILVSLYLLQRFSEDNLARQYIFYAGFFAGSAVLFFLPSLLFIPVLLVLVLLEQGSLRNFLLTITGLLMPWFFLITGYYLIDWLIISPRAAINPGAFRLPYMPWTYWVPAGFLLLLTVLGGIRHGQQRSLQLSTTKQTVDAFALYVLLIVVGFLLSGSAPLYYLAALALPVSFFASVFFGAERLRRGHYILFWLIILLLAYFQIVYFQYPHLLEPHFGALPAPNV